MTIRYHQLLSFVLASFIAAPLAAQDLPPVRDDVFEGPEHTYVAHPFDQQHIVVDVRIDPKARSVTGHSELHVRPLEPMRTIRLMAADMVVDSVIVTTGGRRFRAPFEQSGFDSLLVTLTPEETAADSVSGDEEVPDTLSMVVDSLVSSAPAALDKPFVVSTYYTAHPTIGLYFVEPYDHEAAEHVQIWSQGETEGNRHWFPLYDVPDDKLTSEVIVTIDSAYTVVSNGSIESDRLNDDGTRTVHFSQSRPHSPYLISIAADDYISIRSHAMLEDGTRIPLAYHVLPERADDVERTLGATPEIIAYFSEMLDVPYPWARYDQTFVRDFMWGGMENTGAVTLMDRMLVDERAVLDYDPERIVAHEIAHQWFGDLVTARDWSHAWIHEGLTSYLEALNTERVRGREDFLLEMQANFDAYLRESRDYLRPVVWNRWIEPMNVFDRHAFDKGSWVAHMLRSKVGDEVFFDILERFLKDNAHQAVTTEDFQEAVEAVTGDDYEAFFDQWLHSAGHPVVDVRT
ncbi:MAG TPA: M1 family metallopeptidase, partial [Rhodothermales bacterium]